MNFSYQRTTKQAIGWYLMYLAISIVADFAIGQMASMAQYRRSKTPPASACWPGSYRRSPYHLALAVLLLWHRAKDASSIMLVLASIVLSIVLGGLGGLIPLAMPVAPSRHAARARAFHARRLRLDGALSSALSTIRRSDAEAQVLAASAASTRSGVIGYCRSRTPVASKKALAIAATVAPITSSPAPVEGSSMRCTTTGVTVRMLREAQHRVDLPVEAGDAALVEQHLLLEHAAHRLDHLADDLGLDQPPD